MTFGERIRELRRGKDLTLRGLAAKVEVGFTYISKIENGKLDFGDCPSEALIRKLAQTLDAEENELLVLAKKIPEAVKKRFIQRPDVFGKLASLDDDALDRLMKHLARLERKGN